MGRRLHRKETAFNRQQHSVIHARVLRERYITVMNKCMSHFKINNFDNLSKSPDRYDLPSVILEIVQQQDDAILYKGCAISSS